MENSPAGEMSMEDLLAEAAQFQEKLKAREIVWVKVVQVQGDQVLADIGEKREAMVPLAEFAPPPAVGSRIPVVLVSYGKGDTPAVLSHKKARRALGWSQAQKAFQEKTRVRGTVGSAVKGGFLVDVGGVPAFLPSSLADLRPVRKPQALVGTGVRCYIIEMDAAKGQLILSRKAVLEEENQKRKAKLLERIKVGDVLIGRVGPSSPSGVTVQLGAAQGFIATEDVAWKAPEKAKAALAYGSKVRAKVLRVDAQSGRIALGLRQLTANPADHLKKKYPAKTVVKGKIVEAASDGVRMKLNDSVTAFCPANELPRAELRPEAASDARKEAPPLWPKVGEEVSAIVIGVNYNTFELTVSIRRYEDVQDRKRVARYLKGAPALTLGQLLNPEEGH